MCGPPEGNDFDRLLWWISSANFWAPAETRNPSLSCSCRNPSMNEKANPSNSKLACSAGFSKAMEDLQLESLTPSLERLHLGNETRRLPTTSPNPSFNLRPLHCSTFKRTTKAERKEKRDKKEKEIPLLLLHQQSELAVPSTRLNPAISSVEWPIQPLPPPRPRTGWVDPKPRSCRPATAEEKAKNALVQLQRNAFKSCRDFFSRKEGSDDDVMEEEEDDDRDDAETEVFRFFLGLFRDDGNLKRCYEKGGEFLCLVCGGKRFGDCVALIQHSAAISKTKRRAAHRAFGRALCRVLGWDVSRFGIIGSNDSIVQSMIKPNLNDGTEEDNVVNQKDADVVATDEESMDCCVMTTLH